MLGRLSAPIGRLLAASLLGCASTGLALGCGGGAATTQVVTVTAPGARTAPPAVAVGGDSKANGSAARTQSTAAKPTSRSTTTTASTPATGKSPSSSTDQSASAVRSGAKEGSSSKLSPAPSPTKSSPGGPATSAKGRPTQPQALLSGCLRRLRSADKLTPKRRAKLEALCRKLRQFVQ